MTSWKAAIHASLACLLLAAFLFPIAGWDIFWHLRVGQDVLATGAFPTGDVYSHTRPGGMYVEDEWLFQVLALYVHRLGGWNGLVLAKVLVMGAGAALLYFECRALSGSHSLAALLVGLCEVGARSRMTERPDVLNLFFFPALLLLVSAARRTGSSRFLLCLPPLFGIWGNCHSGATLGLIVLMGFALADVTCHLLPAFLPKASEGNPWHLLGVAVLSIPCTLVNPIRARILTFPFEVVGVHRTVEWSPTPAAAFPLFYGLAAAFLAGTVICYARFGKFDLGELGVYATLLYLGQSRVRMMGIFCVSVALPLARLAGIIITGLPVPRSALLREVYRQRLHATAAALLQLGALYFIFFNDYYALGLGLTPRQFPVKAADFILRERPPREMYNEFTPGGYLLHSLFPTYKVFVDNREEPYYSLLDEVLSAHNPVAARGTSNVARREQPQFTAILDRYHCNFAVLEMRDAPILVEVEGGPPVPTGSSSLWFPRRDWALVYWDDRYLVLVRRSAASPEWSARFEPALDPEDWRLGLARAEQDPAFREAALRDLDRKLAQDPACGRARWLQAQLRSIAPVGPPRNGG